MAGPLGIRYLFKLLNTTIMKTKPSIALKIQLGRTTKCQSVKIPDQWWMLTYSGDICQVINSFDHTDRTEYTRNGWTTQNTAQGKADRLNHQMKTDQFGIVQVIQEKQP